MKLKLGNWEESLVRPRPHQITACLVGEKDDGEVNLAKQCAALGLCWPTVGGWPAKTRPEPWRIGRPIVDYGIAVFDVLVDAGLAPSEVWRAASEAYNWATGLLPAESEVQAAADFSGAPTGG